MSTSYFQGAIGPGFRDLPHGLGTLMQQISAQNYVGKRVRFSGFVKTKEVEGWCGLWFRIDAFLGVTLKLDVDKHTPTTDFVPEEVFPDLLLNPQFEEL